MKRGRFLFIMLLVMSQLSAKAQDYEPVHELSMMWYYNDGSISLPYVKGNNINTQAIHFRLNLKRYTDNSFTITHPYAGVLFVNGKIFAVSEEEFDRHYPVDSLLNLYPEGNILLTYFSESRDYESLQTAISTVVFNIESQSLPDETLAKTIYERSGLIIILLLILFFFAVALNRNGKSFHDFYSVEEALAGRIKDDSVYKLKLFSQNNLAIFLFHASVISFLIILLSRYSDSIFSFEKYFSNSDLVNWIIISILIFLAFFFKYFVIRYIGELFDLGSSANYYFYEYMRLSMTFFMTLLVIASVVVISFPHAAEDMAAIGINLTFLFMVLRLVFLYFRIGKVSGFKNVHLFSYLCTTETLPIIVGMRYFLT